MESLKLIGEAVVRGKKNDIEPLIQAALEQGVAPVDILNEGLLSGMQVIAVRFKNNDIYVPEVLIAARAMSEGLRVLHPLLADEDIGSQWTVLLGTVKGDLHDIGKKLVGMMLEGAGFKVIDIGIDITPEAFATAVEEHQPDLLGMSALLTTTMSAMEQTIKLLAERGLRKNLKIVVGGAPITASYAEEIGADGYAGDAGSAVEVAKALVS